MSYYTEKKYSKSCTGTMNKKNENLILIVKIVQSLNYK